jgi:hypothetical protein
MNLAPRERRWTALALLCLLVLFFERPLQRLDDGIWSTADLMQMSPFTRVSSEHTPANRLLSDPAVQMQPWLLFGLDELRAGRLPLWNPYNGGGQPLLANYQSSLLSPFNLPFLVLPFGMALLASALIKLFCLGFFTFLLLRLWQLKPLPAFVGGLAFAFCGHNVFTLAYPHPGALIVLPAGMFCVERALLAWRRSRLGKLGPRAHWPWLVGLALCCGLGALAGHPEPYFFAGLCLAGWISLRLTYLLWRERRSRGEFFAALRLGLGFLVVAVLGTGLAAIQIAPFVEYLEHSAAAHTRKHNLEAFILGQWPLLGYPDLLGNPSKSVWPKLTLPGPNYEGANMLYPGALVLLLAAFGLVTHPRRKLTAAMGVLLAIWFLYAYNIGGLAKLASTVPLLKQAPINRSQPAALFLLACLAALGVDRLWQLGAQPSLRRPWKPAALLLIGLLGLWLGLKFGAAALLERHAADLGPPESIQSFSAAHRRKIDLSLWAGALCLLGLAFARRPWQRAGLGVLGVLAVFYQLGWIHRNYNPTIDRDLFYPTTPALEGLRERTQGEAIAILGDPPIIAESNLVHRIPLLANYDALAIADHDMALHLLFDPSEMAKNPRLASTKALKLFGIKYLLYPGEWPLFETEFARELARRNQPARLQLVTAGREIVQTWRPARDGLQAAMLTVLIPPSMEGELELILESVQDGRELARAVYTDSDLQQDALEPQEIDRGLPRPANYLARELILAFPPESKSKDLLYHLRVRCSATALERAPRVVQLHELNSQRALLSANREPLPGMLRGDLSYAWHDVEPLERLSSMQLARYKPSLGRFFVVDGFRRGNSKRELQQALIAPGPDPYRLALFGPGHGPEGDGAQASGPATPVEVLSSEPNRIRLAVERERPGLLIAAQSHFPGWVARVNGQTTPLWKANYAFCAVSVPAGKSEVVLSYEPQSLRLGGLLSVLSALLLGLGWWHGRRGALPWAGP